jgi:hypothetical protein
MVVLKTANVRVVTVQKQESAIMVNATMSTPKNNLNNVFLFLNHYNVVQEFIRYGHHV